MPVAVHDHRGQLSRDPADDRIGGKEQALKPGAAEPAAKWRRTDRRRNRLGRRRGIVSAVEFGQFRIADGGCGNRNPAVLVEEETGNRTVAEARIGRGEEEAVGSSAVDGALRNRMIGWRGDCAAGNLAEEKTALLQARRISAPRPHQRLQPYAEVPGAAREKEPEDFVLDSPEPRPNARTRAGP